MKINTKWVFPIMLGGGVLSCMLAWLLILERRKVELLKRENADLIFAVRTATRVINDGTAILNETTSNLLQCLNRERFP